MSDTEQLLIEYLRKKSNKNLMTPAQLAEEIPCSAKQQSVYRKLGTFPIPHKKIGSKVYYSIYHVAEYILRGDDIDTSSHNEKLTVSPPPKPKAKKQVLQKRGIADLSHLFSLRSFVARIHQEAQDMTALAELMHRYEKSYTLKQRLEQDIYIDDSEEIKKNAI